MLIDEDPRLPPRQQVDAILGVDRNTNDIPVDKPAR
jgi:hypothetical protein